MTITRQEKLKVAQVLYSGLGGQGSVFSSLAEANPGDSIQFQAVFYGIEPLKPEYGKFCEQHGLPYRLVLKNPGLDLASWKAVYLALKELRPDVILLHSLNLILVALFYCLVHRCRLVSVEHTPNASKRKSEWLWSFISLLVSGYVVLLSPFYKQELRGRFGFFMPKGKLRVIPNGVNTSLFSCLRNYDEKPTVLAMHSRFTAAKDHETLLLAFRQLVRSSEKYPALELHLAGDGETLAQVKELVNDLSLQQSVVFPGMLPADQVIPFLCRAHLYLYSSLAETACTSVLQAMACGLPIVATDIPGVNDLVAHNESALLFPDGGHNQLADITSALLDSPGLRMRLGTEARKQAEQIFSHRKQFSAYSELWRDLLTA